MQTKWILFFSLSLSVAWAEKYSLDTLCKKGVENNPKIKSFEHKTSASHSAYNQRVDKYKPQITVSGSVGYQNYSYDVADDTEVHNGYTNNYQASLKQSIYSLMLLRSIATSEEIERLARLREEDEKAKLIVNILQNSFELVGLRETIDILKKKEQLLKKAYENIQKKNQLKLASQVDLYQALSRLQQSRSDLAKAKQRYILSLYTLRLSTKYEKVESYIKPLIFNIDAVKHAYRKINLPAIKNSYIRNTRVRLDRQAVKIAKEQIGLRKSERYPTVDAHISYGDIGGTIDQVTRQNESKAMLMLNFPLYQGGYVTDRAEEARYLYLAAQADAENMQMNIKISLEKALQNIDSGLESAKADRLAIEASKKYLDAAILSYQSGLGSLTDAYIAESEFYDSKLRLTGTKTSIFISVAEIYYYSGMTDYRFIREMQKKYLTK